MYCDLFEWHKRGILTLAQHLDDTGRLSSLAMKVSWLARYHNNTIGTISDSYFSEMGYARDSLSISVDEVSTLIDLPAPIEL
jgi:hypothetical protein